MSAERIDIRTAVLADARAIGEVHVAAWRATYAGIVAQGYLDALSVDERTAQWERRLSDVSASRSDILVADIRGCVVGFVAGGPRRTRVDGYDAQLHAIYVRSEAQGRGAGRRLVQAWATVVLERGFRSAMVDVLARNPSREFYERLGARHVADIEVSIGCQVYLESRYGWPDLHVLTA